MAIGDHYGTKARLEMVLAMIAFGSNGVNDGDGDGVNDDSNGGR